MHDNESMQTFTDYESQGRAIIDKLKEEGEFYLDPKKLVKKTEQPPKQDMLVRIVIDEDYFSSPKK